MMDPREDIPPALDRDVRVLHAMIQRARDIYGDRAVRIAWRRIAGPESMDSVTPAMVREAARTLYDARLARTLSASHPHTPAPHPDDHPDDLTEDVHLVLGVCGIGIQAHD